MRKPMGNLSPFQGAKTATTSVRLFMKACESSDLLQAFILMRSETLAKLVQAPVLPVRIR